MSTAEPRTQTGTERSTDGLVVDDLRVAYGRAQILMGLSLNVASTDVVGLVGQNGVGKTTTLRAISGVVPRQAQALTFRGAQLPSSPHQVARRGVIHVPEGRGIFSDLTVIDNLRYGAAAVGRDLPTEQLDLLLDAFPILARLLKRRAGLLSGGEQQMLTVARGLAANPKLLMVDEASLGLAPRAVDDVFAATAAWCRDHKTALLLVDQNVMAIADVCDRVYVLHDGRAVPLDHVDDDARNQLVSMYY